MSAERALAAAVDEASTDALESGEVYRVRLFNLLDRDARISLLSVRAVGKALAARVNPKLSRPACEYVTVGARALAESAHVSDKTARRAVVKLERLGYCARHGTAEERRRRGYKNREGTTFRVLAPEIITSAQLKLGPLTMVTESLTMVKETNEPFESLQEGSSSYRAAAAAQDDLVTVLEKLGVWSYGLLAGTRSEPDRARAWLEVALAEAKTSPAGLWVAGFASGEWPSPRLAATTQLDAPPR